MPSALDLLHEPKVHEVRTLGWHDDHAVKELLRSVANQVQFILRKRKWVVPILSEMYPDNPRLLGLNVGGGGGSTSEIRIRVRQPYDKRQLLPMDCLLGTMLHELVHNVRGPHDAMFYQLLDELNAEFDEMLMKGAISADQAFLGPGQRLGGHSILQHNPPSQHLRQLAVQAAETRAKRARLMPSGPQKLGSAAALGAEWWRSVTPTQAAAAAAERRAADDIWCPCGAAGPAGAPGSSGARRSVAQVSIAPAEHRKVSTMQGPKAGLEGSVPFNTLAPASAAPAAVQPSAPPLCDVPAAARPGDQICGRPGRDSKVQEQQQQQQVLPVALTASQRRDIQARAGLRTPVVDLTLTDSDDDVQVRPAAGTMANASLATNTRQAAQQVVSVPTVPSEQQFTWQEQHGSSGAVKPSLGSEGGNRYPVPRLHRLYAA